MAELNHVYLYLDYLNTFAPLPDAARSKLVMAMLIYGSTGEAPDITGPAKYAWPGIKSQMDRDRQKYREKCEANRIKGAKGGRAPRKATACQSLAQEAKEKEKEKENENEKEKEKDKDNTLPSLPFSPPTVQEVSSFCAQQGITMDVQQFVDYYTSIGWTVGNKPMRDWQAAARNWKRKEMQFGKTELGRTDPIYGTVL